MTIRTVTTAFARFGDTIRLSMCKLNEIQFSAPWNPEPGRCAGQGL